MTMPVALITGGTGFVGSRLVARLVRDGWRVHVVTRQALVDSAAVRFHRVDAQAGGWEGLLQATRPDVVFHLATLFLVEHRPDQIDELLDANLRLGTHLLDAMSRAGTRRFVNATTSWQHRLPDEAAPHAVNLYAATKQAFEAIVDYHVERHDLSAVSLRLFDSYGPADPRPKLLNLLLRLDAAAAPLALSAGEQRLCMVHVDDVVEALRVAAAHTAGQPGHARFGLGGVPAHSLRQIVALIEALSGRRLPVAWGARAYRDREVMEPWRALTPLPGWTPRIGLEAGLAELLASPA